MKKITLCGFAITLVFALTTSFTFADDVRSIKGLITKRTADAITIRASDGTSQAITLTDDTKVQSPKGLGLRKEEMSWTSLIPGLKVSVKGVSDTSGNFVATEIKFNKDDLQTASMIQAGLTPTEEKVATNAENISANKEGIAANAENISLNSANIAKNKAQIASNQEEVSRRFEELADYQVKNQATIYFESGKSALGTDDKNALAQLAAEATKLSGYIIEVQGFADSTGNAAANQSLSKDRAYAVVNYLMQDANVPPRHIVSPGAMGISNPAASNETTHGRSQNRRVEVKVMVNKGILAAKQ
ncbi:MAG TPA: OmpA family protein [Terriglobales bacterium]|nr:OmpA family protein [Terriglobales bacterium]